MSNVVKWTKKLWQICNFILKSIILNVKEVLLVPKRFSKYVFPYLCCYKRTKVCLVLCVFSNNYLQTNFTLHWTSITIFTLPTFSKQGFSGLNCICHFSNSHNEAKIKTFSSSKYQTTRQTTEQWFTNRSFHKWLSEFGPFRQR